MLLVSSLWSVLVSGALADVPVLNSFLIQSRYNLDQYFVFLPFQPQFLYFQYAERGFQTDTLKLICDWLALSDTIFDWLRAPSSKHQFENLPEYILVALLVYEVDLLVQDKIQMVI